MLAADENHPQRVVRGRANFTPPQHLHADCRV